MNRQTATAQTNQTTKITPLLAGGILQRKCACGQHTIAGGECDDCGKKQLGLQRTSKNSQLDTGNSGGVPAIVHEVLRSPGQPLDASTRAFMEPRFGHDFSRVRVHTDPRAEESARAMSALAYTVGRDIAFAEGQYAPGISTGQRLLAHELVHVVQQSSAASNGSDSLVLGDTRSAGELEAEQLADRLIVPVAATPAAPSENRQSRAAYTPGNSIIQRQTQGEIQRQVPSTVPVVGVAIAAANFAMSLRPAGQGGLTETDVQFRYARNESGPDSIREARYTILHIDSIKGLGLSYGFWELVLRYDGRSIIAAYTQQKKIVGYDGGTLGSEVGVNFAAVEASGATEPVAKAYLTFSGFNNPSGPGFQRFVGRLLVEGNGLVTPDECQLTEGDGFARFDEFWCDVGWD